MLSTKLKEAAGNSADATLYVDDVFSTYLYTGNGSTQTITNGIDLAGKGGLVWIKSRNNGALQGRHWLSDTARGVDSYLETNNGSAANIGGVSSFGINGYSLTGGSGINWSNDTFASWTFRKAAKFFDVQTVTHTNGTANNIDLSVLGTVGMVIAKTTTTAGDWTVWQRSLTAGNNIQLNSTAAQSATNTWLSVSGTTATLAAAAPTGTYVIYAYAHDTSSTGIIQCGTFTGGTWPLEVNLGWEPQFVLVKAASTTSSWWMVDTMRGLSQTQAATLRAETSGAEADLGANYIGVTSTGFILKTSAGGMGFGGSNNIYMAIRRPNKPPTTGTQVYNAIARTGTGAAVTVTGVGFAPDFRIGTFRSAATAKYTFSKLIAPFNNLATNLTRGENIDNTVGGNFYNDGFYEAGYLSTSGHTFIDWLFKRAPGFFDVVCYTGTGSATTQAHNLGVAPEMMIIKSRSNTGSWWVYDNYLSSPTTKYLRLNEAIPAGAGGGDLWNSTAPTNSVFSVGIAETNYSGYTYVAYLFATLAGIQYINSYVGDGTTGRVINCGFSAGARFICIKATSTTGSWWVWDSARGITSTNDPALQLNSTAAEITSADAIDPSSSGFIVNQEATCSINASGVSYLVWAIA